MSEKRLSEQIKSIEGLAIKIYENITSDKITQAIELLKEVNIQTRKIELQNNNLWQINIKSVKELKNNIITLRAITIQLIPQLEKLKERKTKSLLNLIKENATIIIDKLNQSKQLIGKNNWIESETIKIGYIILENNKKVQRIALIGELIKYVRKAEDSENDYIDADELCKLDYFTQPTIVDGEATIAIKEGKEIPKENTINKILEMILSSKRGYITNYEKFKQKLKKYGITKLDYVTAYYNYGEVFNMKDGVSPRLRFRFVHMSPDKDYCWTSTGNARIVLLGLKNKIGNLIFNWEFDYGTRMSFFESRLNFRQVYFSNEEGDDEKIDSERMISDPKYKTEVIRQVKIQLLNFIENRRKGRGDYSKLSDQEAETLIKDFNDYGNYLDRAYADMEQFVAEIESLKTK